MENDFCRYSIKRFVSLIRYIESVLYSLENHCLLISERINSLNSRVFCSEKLVIDLDYREEFRNIANYSIRDFMLLDDKSRLKNSYFELLKDCQHILVLIKDNFPKFFNYSPTILNRSEIFAERAVDVNMEDIQPKSYEQIFRSQKKEDIKIKAKKAAATKSNKKISNFKSSLEKLFRIKSKSEKSLKPDDLVMGIIPPTIYLSPQQTVSLSRDTWYITKAQQMPPSSKQLIRHSCSDFVCRRSSTFCMLDTVSTNQRRHIVRAVSPPVNMFYPVTEEEYHTNKVVSPSYSTVPHSTSMPAHLSKSHQNITKCNKEDIDNCKPAKRTARKKGLFNCSLFRKRTNSHSKSVENIKNDTKIKNTRSRDKSKSLNRSETKMTSNLSDRCLTLPNLKSSEVDLTQNVHKHQLLSMDLIKDYLNRSDNSLQSSMHRNSVDCSVLSPGQQFPASVHNSPTSLSNKCHCDLKKFKTSNPRLSESFYSQPSASNDLCNSRCSRAVSPLTISSCAFDSTCYKYSSVTSAPIEHQKPPCLRQTSAPISYQPSQPPAHQYLSSPPPTNSAFEFWTRPYHEKMKASRRRLLDDKEGSKEALLRSLSPHNIKTTDSTVIYDNPYYLHIIPEPSTYQNNESHGSEPCSQSPISHSKSFYNAVQYRLTSQDNIFCDYRPHSSASPVIENRLLESPISVSKRQNTVTEERCGNDYIIYDAADHKKNFNEPTLNADNQGQSQIESNRSSSEKILSLEEKDFEGSLPEIKDNKSINSSTELILTRTPTPPHSFAESSASSIYPAPTEFVCDLIQTQPNTNRLCGIINLLYTSDNSDDNDEEYTEFDKIEIEPMPPVPPPRTDSVLRSLQSQNIANRDADKSELEYDISDEFPPVFSGANIDRCDIEQYHKWLEKLPYKIAEFPNLRQYRKSALSSTYASRISPLIENINSVTENIEKMKLKQSFRQSRKSIKSWNTSDSSRVSDNGSVNSHGQSSSDSFSMKKSFSYDQCLNNFEMPGIEEVSPTVDITPPFTVTDSTLLKQYSHLYSLKPSPSQTSARLALDSSAASVKFQRSKSIDLRNFVNNNNNNNYSNDNNNTDKAIIINDNFAQNRKSVPNSNCSALGTIMTNEISGKNALDTSTVAGSAYKVYPML